MATWWHHGRQCAGVAATQLEMAYLLGPNIEMVGKITMVGKIALHELGLLVKSMVAHGCCQRQCLWRVTFGAAQIPFNTPPLRQFETNSLHKAIRMGLRPVATRTPWVHNNYH